MRECLHHIAHHITSHVVSVFLSDRYGRIIALWRIRHYWAACPEKDSQVSSPPLKALFLFLPPGSCPDGVPALTSLQRRPRIRTHEPHEACVPCVAFGHSVCHIDAKQPMTHLYFVHWYSPGSGCSRAENEGGREADRPAPLEKGDWWTALWGMGKP